MPILPSRSATGLPLPARSRSDARKLRSGALLFLLAAGFAASAEARELRFVGFAALRGDWADAALSYREGGFGRLPLGEGNGQDVSAGAGLLNLTGDWRSDNGWRLAATVVGQAAEDSSGTQDLGFTEFFLEKRWERARTDTVIRGGHFLLPTSRENIEPGWTSPYSLSFSAINSWIAEEVRPLGLLWSTRFGAQRRFHLGAAAFGGNDSAGSLLAWRGWSLDHRIVAFNEVVPLPPLESLGPGGVFSEQKDSGTRSFGSDLDDRVGWAGFIELQPTEALSFIATHYDNRGDKQLYGRPNRAQYAWATDFYLLGAEAHVGGWSFLAEWMDGHTGMGDLNSFHVRADFRAAYAAVSWARNEDRGPRLTLRYDDFSTVDLDGTSAERNDDEGTAWTAALLWSITERVRLGLEVQDVDGQRPEAARAGFSTQNGGERVSLELRYRFDLRR